MAWKKSVTGLPLCVQLLEDDDPHALDVQVTTEAGENILALAELAVHKAFCRMSVPHDWRPQCQDDAVQEAALVIAEYATHGPRPVYMLAIKRALTWILKQVWQSRPQTNRERREGRHCRAPQLISLDALDWEPLLEGAAGYSKTPEAVLITTEEVDTRESCVERFYDIVYDLVANRMGLERRRHYTALNDAEVFQLTLRGYTYKGIAEVMGCTEDLAIQRVTYAQRRLASVLEEQGVDEVAGWYDGEHPLPDVRAQQTFIERYVDERTDQYRREQRVEPGRRQIEEWKRQARERWAKQGAQSNMIAVAAD